MSNFTEEIKYEIIKNGVDGRNEAVAFLSAFIRTSGSILVRDGGYGFEIITENERTAEFISRLTDSYFSLSLNIADATRDLKNGKDKLTFDCVGEAAAKLMQEAGFVVYGADGMNLNFGIDERLLADENCASAYLCGAFLGGGSCTLPEEQAYSKTGYHYEVVFSNKITAYDFCDLLCDFLILAKMVERKDSAVVYVKSKEVISDTLEAMRTRKCLEKFNRVVYSKDKRNNDNRVSNCAVSNIDKAVTASVAQVRAIEIIAQTVGLKQLNENLFEVATARLADRNASMQELADRLKISKSCINHRMRKIMDIAAQLM